MGREINDLGVIDDVDYYFETQKSAGGVGSSYRRRNPWRGGFDASVNLYPSSGGSGTAGMILAGDEWYVTVVGTISAEQVNPKSILKALVNSPGQDGSKWRII